MNLLTEYVSRPHVAISLLKLPCSIIGNDSSLNPRTLIISSVNKDEVSLELYGSGNKDIPELITQGKMYSKYLFDSSAYKNIFSGCKMMPYIYENYPISEIVNDPPQNIEQELKNKKYFTTIHNSKTHQEYRRMIIWLKFIRDNIFSDSYKKTKDLPKTYWKRITDGSKFIEPQDVKLYDKETWNKWVSWCEKLILKKSNDWATELLFAKTLPRMNKKEMASLCIPWTEEGEAA